MVAGGRSGKGGNDHRERVSKPVAPWKGARTGRSRCGFHPSPLQSPNHASPWTIVWLLKRSHETNPKALPKVPADAPQFSLPKSPGSPKSCRRFPLSPSEGERAGVMGKQRSLIVRTNKNSSGHLVSQARALSAMENEATTALVQGCCKTASSLPSEPRLAPAASSMAT